VLLNMIHCLEKKILYSELTANKRAATLTIRTLFNGSSYKLRDPKKRPPG